MRRFALTYPQLMGQAEALDLEDATLVQLREGYEFAEEMADGVWRAHGAPLISHLVRTASILLAERRPLSVVLAGLLHAAPILHLFEGSRRTRLGGTRWRELSDRFGMPVAELVRGYERLCWDGTEDLERHLGHLERAGDRVREVIRIRLANDLEDHLDLGLGFATAAGAPERRAGLTPLRLALARALLSVEFQQELEQALHACATCDVSPALVRARRKGYERSRRWAERPCWLRLLKQLRRRVAR